MQARVILQRLVRGKLRAENTFFFLHLPKLFSLHNYAKQFLDFLPKLRKNIRSWNVTQKYSCTNAQNHLARHYRVC